MGLAEITLQSMHKYVRYAAGGLECRQGVGALRIHYCKLWTAQIAVAAPLEIQFVVGDDSAVRHLASRCRDGKDHSYRHRILRGCLCIEEIPHVTVICKTVTDSFGRIYHAATPDGKDEVDMLFFAKRYAISDQRQFRIGYHSPQLDVRYSSRTQHRAYFSQEAASFSTSASVMYQHLMGSVLGEKARQMLFG